MRGIGAKWRWIVAVAVLAYAASPAGAQTGSSTAAGSASATGGADAQVGFQQKAPVTPQEKLAESERILGRMEQAAAGIRRQLEEARKQRDVVRTLCLNDKLNQVDVAIRSAKERKQALSVAVQRNDAELSNHEYTILTVLKQRTDQLTAEANQCIGEEAAFIGDTKVVTSVDRTLPQEDSTEYPPPPTPVIPTGPPSCTSCTL
jgi:hypothetical protein